MYWHCPLCLPLCRFLNAIQTNAQHLVRYLAVAAVVNKRRRNVMKDLMRLIEQESYQVSDPVTDFLQCLFTNYDFDGAQQKLQECEQVRFGLQLARLSTELTDLHCATRVQASKNLCTSSTPAVLI